MNLITKQMKHMYREKRWMLLFLSAIFSLNVFAWDAGSPVEVGNTLPEKTMNIHPQQKGKTISGMIKDKNGEPLIGVNVIVKGSTIGSMTDTDGKFSLQVPENATLKISYIGYKTTELPVGTQNFINILLAENTEVLEEVIVLGYGTAKRRDVIGSISKISSDDIMKIPATNVAESLQGMSSGMMVK